MRCHASRFRERVAVIPSAPGGSHEQKGTDRVYYSKDLLQVGPVIRETGPALWLWSERRFL